MMLLALLAISVAVAAADSAFDLPQFVASCSDTPSASHAAPLSVGYTPHRLHVQFDGASLLPFFLVGCSTTLHMPYQRYSRHTQMRQNPYPPTDARKTAAHTDETDGTEACSTHPAACNLALGDESWLPSHQPLCTVIPPPHPPPTHTHVLHSASAQNAGSSAWSLTVLTQGTGRGQAQAHCQSKERIRIIAPASPCCFSYKHTPSPSPLDHECLHHEMVKCGWRRTKG